MFLDRDYRFSSQVSNLRKWRRCLIKQSYLWLCNQRKWRMCLIMIITSLLQTTYCHYVFLYNIRTLHIEIPMYGRSHCYFTGLAESRYINMAAPTSAQKSTCFSIRSVTGLRLPKPWSTWPFLEPNYVILETLGLNLKYTWYQAVLNRWFNIEIVQISIIKL